MTDFRQTVADSWSTDTSALVGGAAPVSIANQEPWRLAVTIKADPNNGGPIYVVPSARKIGGVPVEPGAALTLNTTAEVFAYSPTAAAVVVVISESASC